MKSLKKFAVRCWVFAAHWLEFCREEWQDYRADCHFAQYDPEGNGKPREPSYIEFASILSRVFWNNFKCSLVGHDIIDESVAGPDSGCMDHYCKRCGRYWHVTLY